jgi:hypothetical protein
MFGYLHRITGSPDHRITGSPDHRITGSPDHWITKKTPTDYTEKPGKIVANKKSLCLRVFVFNTRNFVDWSLWR